MPVRLVQIKTKGIIKMNILLRINFVLVDIKLKRLNKKYNKLLDKYKKEYLGI